MCVWCRAAPATEADHVPALAAFPPGDAFKMAKRDEEKGLRMTERELADYLVATGLDRKTAKRWIEQYKAMAAEAAAAKTQGELFRDTGATT